MKNHLASVSTLALLLFCAAVGISCASKPAEQKQICEPQSPSNSQEAEEGGLDRDYIACILNRDAIGNIRRCYESTFGDKGYTSAPVHIMTRFQIDTDGKVRKVEAESPTASEKLKACAAKTVQDLNFAKPFGNVPVKVAYPWQLRRAEGNNLESIFDN